MLHEFPKQTQPAFSDQPYPFIAPVERSTFTPYDPPPEPTLRLFNEIQPMGSAHAHPMTLSSTLATAISAFGTVKTDIASATPIPTSATNATAS
jgi:hypothetical protein